MADMSLMIILVLVGLLVMIVTSQQKFKNKMLCTFIRPNRQEIEKFVPLYNKYVVFDRGRYGIGHYVVDPKCITMMWYDRGINKLFPILIPKLEFKWDTPYPRDPTTFQHTHQTPEARAAGWSEQSHLAFAKGTAQQTGSKSRFPEWFFPAITIAVLLIVMYLVYAMGGRLDYLEQLIQVGQ